MAAHPDRSRSSHARDGIVVVRTGRSPVSAVVLASGALFLAALAGIAWILLAPSSPPPRSAPAATVPPGRPPVPIPESDPAAPPVPTAAPTVNAPRPAKSPAAASEGGEKGSAPRDESADSSGLAAFPPLGTKPLLRGIVVPDGFELPPGYVRHYQVTDDGQMLPPILRFHPDHQPLDARGNTIAVPPDRVVPPELAPPGMPIQTLEPPPSAGAAPR